MARAPALFLDELSEAFSLLEVSPELGRRYMHPGVPGVRRLLLRATRYHVYYVVEREQVVVLSVWSAVRGRGPTGRALRRRPRMR